MNHTPIPFDLLTAYFEDTFIRKEFSFLTGVLVAQFFLTGVIIFLLLKVFKVI